MADKDALARQEIRKKKAWLEKYYNIKNRLDSGRGGFLFYVGQAFRPAGLPDIPVRCLCLVFSEGIGTRCWRAPLTGRQECLPYRGGFCYDRGTTLWFMAKSKRHLVSGMHHRDHLPHLKREGASYFVTFRLAGTLPAEVLLKLKQEREVILAQATAAKRPLTWQEQEELFQWYASRVDRELDAGHGNCWMRRPEIAGLVADALRFHAGQRFDLLAWVVMPNHVHAVLRPLPGWTLSGILKSWKGFSSRKANLALKRTGKPFWQLESYDHLIRDDEDSHRCCRYTTMNPVNAGLCKRPEDWPWSSLSRVKV
jgi:REP element-mobilizing transposase RayT